MPTPTLVRTHTTTSFIPYCQWHCAILCVSGGAREPSGSAPGPPPCVSASRRSCDKTTSEAVPSSFGHANGACCRAVLRMPWRAVSAMASQKSAGLALAGHSTSRCPSSAVVLTATPRSVVEGSSPLACHGLFWCGFRSLNGPAVLTCAQPSESAAAFSPAIRGKFPMAQGFCAPPTHWLHHI